MEEVTFLYLTRRYVQHYQIPLVSGVVTTLERTSMPILFGLLYGEHEVDFN